MSQTVELISLGERLGYRCGWIPDQGFHRDPFVLLALAAAATREMAIGLGVTSPFTRLPVQIARAAGALDEVAHGRFKLGLGTANVENVIRPLGARFEKPVGRLRDAITIIRRLLAGERVTFDGVDDHLRGVKLEFDTEPNIPIYIGTRGTQTLELSGQIADGVLVESLFNAGGMPHVLGCLERGATKGGRQRSAIDVVAWQLILVTDDPAAAITRQKPWIARGLQIGPPENMQRIGVDPEVVAAVAEAMNRGDRDAAVAHITDDAVRCLMVAGTPSQVRDQVAGIFDRGADAVTVLSVGPLPDVSANLKRFARDVMPAFTS